MIFCCMLRTGLLIAFFILTPQLFAENIISLHVGGSTYCDEDGCFGPTGIAYGATFTHAFSERWSLAVDATLACTWEDLPERLDDEGNLFIPERERTRFWTGVTALRNWNSEVGTFYAGGGVIAGYEWQKVIPKSRGSYSRKSSSGLKAGVSAIAGYRFGLSRRWGVGPEVSFYLLPDSLSAIRYSAFVSGKF